MITASTPLVLVNVNIICYRNYSSKKRTKHSTSVLLVITKMY